MTMSLRCGGSQARSKAALIGLDDSLTYQSLMRCPKALDLRSPFDKQSSHIDVRGFETMLSLKLSMRKSHPPH